MRASVWNTPLASLQWLFFIFVNTLIIPISVGTAFDLPLESIASMVRTSLLLTGVACIAQGTIGHRFPIMEGHAGLMWGIFLSLCASAASMGMSLIEIGGGIATGMLISGGLIVCLALLNRLQWLEKLFTPVVLAVYMFLLTFQLVLVFFNGMLKVMPDGSVHLPMTLLSIVIVIVVGFLKIKGGKHISSYSILIGMVGGWIAYAILFPDQGASASIGSGGLIWFPLGTPNWSIGIIVTVVVANLINFSNTFAALQSASPLLKKTITSSMYRRSFSVTGILSMAAAMFGLVAYAPYSSSIGYLESTQIFDRKPFLISGGMMIILGIVPVLGGFLATIPITVGNAVLFVAYLQLFGTSLKGVEGMKFDSNTIYRIAAPVMIGLCFITASPAYFVHLPAFLQPVLASGFVIGVVISVIFERAINWDSLRQDKSEQQHHTPIQSAEQE